MEFMSNAETFSEVQCLAGTGEPGTCYGLCSESGTPDTALLHIIYPQLCAQLQSI